MYIYTSRYSQRQAESECANMYIYGAISVLHIVIQWLRVSSGLSSISIKQWQKATEYTIAKAKGRKKKYGMYYMWSNEGERIAFLTSSIECCGHCDNNILVYIISIALFYVSFSIIMKWVERSEWIKKISQ